MDTGWGFLPQEDFFDRCHRQPIAVHANVGAVLIQCADHLPDVLRVDPSNAKDQFGRRLSLHDDIRQMPSNQRPDVLIRTALLFVDEQTILKLCNLTE